MAILYEESMDTYHARDAISNSKINVWRQEGPDAYWRYFVAKNLQRPDSAAFRFGRIFDLRVFLTLDLFEQIYAVRPEGQDGRTKEGKAWAATVGDREIINWEDWHLIEEMMEALGGSELATEHLVGGRSQVTIRSELPSLGVTVQARPDYLKSAKGDRPAVLVDLKTTSDLESFRKNCVAYGYHRQLALGQWLLAKEGMQTDAVLVVVEKKLAPRVRVLRIPEHILAAGWESLKSDIEGIAARYKSGNWKDVQEEIEDVEIPAWAERQAIEGVL